MSSFWYHLYDKISIPVLYIVYRLYVLTNHKIRIGHQGRRETLQKLENELIRLSDRGSRFWIHSSSMGEFEQAKPLIRQLKEKIPGCTVIVSVFSPSAYEHIQNYREADLICYLPLDTRKNAKRFISILKPNVGIMVRHDLWPNHLRQLKKGGIPAVLINCSLPSYNSVRHPFGLAIKRFLFSYFDVILTVSGETTQFCRTHALGIGSIETVGDTRYDQVVTRAQQAENIVAPLRKLKGDRKGFVAGSTWPSDEEVVLRAFSMLRDEEKHPWIVLVPHEPTEEHITQIENNLTALKCDFLRFSEVSGNEAENPDVLIVDRVGILASLYALGDLSFVGGGFGPGIHSVLEPAALGKVVLFGPKYKNSYEAEQLKKRGVGFVTHDAAALFDHLLSFLSDASELEKLGKMAAELVQENVGATARIVNRLKKLV